MDKFDIRTAKLLSSVIIMCLVLLCVVANAYKYLPSEDVDRINMVSVEQSDKDEVENINTEVSDSESQGDDVKEDDTVVEEVKEKFEVINEVPQEQISEPQQDEDSYQFYYEKGQNCMVGKDYLRAAENYEKASNLSKNNQEKAECYEKIAIAYATLKRNGTALSYAQKAYNLQPTTGREVLLARLYYKTGDIDKATVRINNVLQRDFTVEN